MNTLLYCFSILLLIPALFTSIYYIFFAVIGTVIRFRIDESEENNNSLRFAIVIPAYNEEKHISDTITACKNLDYPKNKYEVFIIADNCTDRTDEIASRAGAICLKRNDPEKKGKGFALGWGFNQVLAWKQPFDAVVVLDADCRITKNALKVFCKHISNGREVLQANDISSNPDDSALSYALSVGNWMENNLFYLPKSYLGLPVFLRGTGMVFKKNVLIEYPWDAVSVAEDKEYAIHLLKNGKKIVFLGNVKVSSAFPDKDEQFEIQRTRWARGNLSLGKAKAIRFIWQGILKKRFVFVDVGVTLLLDSKPLVLLELAVAILICGISKILYTGILTSLIFRAVVFAGILQICYFAIGITAMGLNKKRLVYLSKAPWLIVRLMIITFKGLFSSGKNHWAKTPREKE